MKNTLVIEQKIATAFLFILLAICIIFKAQSNDSGPETIYSDPAVDNSPHTPVKVVTDSQTHVSNKGSEAWMDALLQDETLQFSEIERFVDAKNGIFKQARYVPHNRSIRLYEGGRLAVVNSLIEISYENLHGESLKTIQKMDVYVKDKDIWVRSKLATPVHFNKMEISKL
tara:strand:+ start:484 stop:996 length:513 start_codon:yes stop_codon:yes gene_type:complete